MCGGWGTRLEPSGAVFGDRVALGLGHLTCKTRLVEGIITKLPGAKFCFPLSSVEKHKRMTGLCGQ